MPSQLHLEVLAKRLSSTSKVLVDQDSSDFQDRLKRWSNINLETPGAIIVPKNEDDLRQSVRWALLTGAPFVAKSGGMSLYSTISGEGVIIDLEEYASITHDAERHEATLIGGVSSKAVAMELAKDGFCTTLPSSNPVGAITFFLNGGNSPLVSKLGYASDNILSARLITATGELITVSEAENADFLYAVRGAGQYFGLVVSLTVKTYPIAEIFGNEEGSFWSGRFIFPIEGARDVAEAMQNIVNNDTYCTGGLIMVAAPPPAKNPVVAVMARLMHPNSEQQQTMVFKSLYDLSPMVTGGNLVRIENNANALQPLMASGDFKKLRLTGLHSYDSSSLPQIADLWTELTTSCPDALATSFSIQWESQPPHKPSFESANSLHDIRFWANNMTWCTDAANVELVQTYLDRVVALTRKHQSWEQYVDFTNSLREPESPITRRYRRTERLQRLRSLKQQWDPDGVFGTELLEKGAMRMDM